MTRQKTTKIPIWVEQIQKYGIETSLAASLLSFYRNGVDTTPDAEVTQAISTFLLAGKSSDEIRWLEEGRGLIESRYYPNRVLFTGYEWVTFKVPGGSYTPDFCYLLDSGKWIYVEVKGSKMQGSYRDARTRLRAAAALNPWHDFYEVIQEKRSRVWNLEKIDPDHSFIEALGGIQ